MMDIRDFAGRHLADIIDVTTDVKPDPQHTSNGFEAHAEIISPFNRYRMSVHSSHLAPPAGAPAECRSLGTIMFHDPVSDTRILGARSDRTFLDISRHVHQREFTDAIAAARRELAEAGPDAIKLTQSKLSDLASRAAKWGIAIDAMPMAPKPSEASPVAVEVAKPATAASMPPAAAATSVAPATPADEPMIGLPIVFIHNPGEGSAGMTTVPGTVTRTWPDGSVGLLMFVDDHEVQHRPKVPRRGTDAGNGRVHVHGCWDLAPWYAALLTERRQLSGRVSALSEKLDTAIADNAKLAERLAALESAKPRRGRPSKPESGDAEAAELATEGETMPAKEAEPDLIGGDR